MSSKFSSAFVVAALLSHTVLAPLTAVAQEQDTSAQQVQKTTDSNKSVSIDSPEASQNVSQDSTTQGNSQTQTENLEGAGATHGGEMSDKSKLDDDGQMKEAESDSATDASNKRSVESIDTWMPDKNLQTAVSEKLGISVSNITKKDMLSLRDLDNAKGKGISNITGLEYASNIRDISLNNNQISDITPLQNLTSLTELGLDNNQISDVTPLQNLTSLIYLDLSSNQISDVTPLQNLTSLIILELDSNQISDVSSLVQLTAMIHAGGQSVVLPEVYIYNRKPYSISIESPIKSHTGLVPVLPQNNDTWTGVYNSGKVEWSGGNQVLERGEL